MMFIRTSILGYFNHNKSVYLVIGSSPKVPSLLRSTSVFITIMPFDKQPAAVPVIEDVVRNCI